MNTKLNDPIALHRESRRLAELRQFDPAIALARRAADAAPNHPGLWYTLGVMLQERAAPADTARAAQAFERALALKPDFHQAWNNLGIARLDGGQTQAAEAAWRHALAIDPAYPAALDNLLALTVAAQRWDEALALSARLLELAPSHPGALRRRLTALLGLERIDDARALLDASRDQQPPIADFRLEMAVRLDLPAVPADEDALRRARQRYLDGLVELERLIEQRPPSPADALGAVERVNFMLAYQGEDDRDAQRAYARLLDGLLNRCGPWPQCATQRRARAPGERLRVGFASSFWRDCTVGHYFGAWVAGLDPERFDKRVYLLDAPADAFTTRLGESARILSLAGSLRETATRLRDEALDVLIYPELGMSTRSFPLAALRLAPIQCAAWGHPVTSGLPSIDYFLSSALMEPPDAATHYSERLRLLPGLGTCYTRPSVGIRLHRADFGLPDDRVLYFHPHALFKIHPEADHALARILAADPTGMVVLCAGQTARMTAAYLARLHTSLAAHGVARERVVVLPVCDRARYLEANRLCDLMLDTPRWSGGNTTLDALAAGLPVVTRRGRFMRGRQSAGMLEALGLPQLIAEDEDDFVRIALDLAHTPSKRAELRRRLNDPEVYGCLFGREEAITALEDFLLEVTAGTGTSSGSSGAEF